jgi:carbon-monoxide dehydrogenase medium subunit
VISPFKRKRPSRVDEALHEIADGAIPYCGGTELVAAMQMGLLAPEVLVDLKGIDELSGLAEVGGRLRIGATTRHRAVALDPLAAAWAACSQLGNQRVRATGSVGGNLCFAEPRSDVMTALIALGADVELRSVRGERVLEVDELAAGAMWTTREDDELLVAVHVPRTSRRQVHLRFQPAEYPTACVALVETAADGPIRVSVGAVGDRPQLFEVAGIGDLDPAGIAADLQVVADLNGAEDYKRHIAEVFLGRAATAWRGLSDGR